MVLRPSDLPADQTPGLEVDFADSPASQAVPFEMTTGNRRSFLAALGAGAAVLGLSGSAVGGEPVKKVAANTKTSTNGASSIGTKESAREAALNEWRRKHILKKPDVFKKEVDEETVANQEIASARLSQPAEKAYYASMLKPDKYQREYPNGVCASDWGPTGKLDTESDTQYFIFRVKIVDTSGNPIKSTTKKAAGKEEEVSWVVIGLNKHRTTPTNPDGIRGSMTLSPDALQSVTRVENALKEAKFVIPSDGLAKN